VTAWLEWFTNVFADSCQASTAPIDEALVRARFWGEHKHVALNARQRKVIIKILEAGAGRFKGGLTQRKYVGMTGGLPGDRFA
jgi:Fic family protein